MIPCRLCRSNAITTPQTICGVAIALVLHKQHMVPMIKAVASLGEEAGIGQSWVALKYLGKGLIKYVEPAVTSTICSQGKTCLAEDYHRTIHSYQEFNHSMNVQPSQYLSGWCHQNNVL